MSKTTTIKTQHLFLRIISAGRSLLNLKLTTQTIISLVNRANQNSIIQKRNIRSHVARTEWQALKTSLVILPLLHFLKFNFINPFSPFLLDFKVDSINITSSVPSATGVGLKWKPLDSYKLGEPVLEYRVEIFDSLRGERFNYTVNSSMTDVDLNILKPFTRYEFKVFGMTSSWEGNITDTIDLKTQEDGMLTGRFSERY